MKIQFSEVVPEPLTSIKHHSQSIWNSQFTVNCAECKNVILNASSGKGKTTFSNLLLGIRRDYKGAIYFDNRDIRTFTTEEWVEIRAKKISVVHQDLQLFSNLTAFENIAIKNELTRSFSHLVLLHFVTY